MAEPEFNEHLGANLKQARELGGLSQLAAAKLMKMKRPTISQSEGGKRKVSAEEVSQFAKAYGVSTSWLLNEESTQDPAVEKVGRLFVDLSKEDLYFLHRLLVFLKKDGDRR